MEYNVNCNNATERINKALETLKDQLIELRSQDVELMKQLIHISDTIKELSARTRQSDPHTPVPFRGGTRSCIGLNVIMSNSLTELTNSRLHSVPSYCSKNNRSLSSVEDVNSSTEDCSVESESDLDDCTCVQMRNKTGRSIARAQSMSTVRNRTSIGKLVEDNCYEEILMRNIKLWKHNMSANTVDSVFT